MARRRNYNRRRRGRFGFLYRLISVLAICAVIVVALTLFFRVDTITVTGENHYAQDEIIQATGLRMGDNLFLLNKYAIAQELLEKLPYIAQVRINRVLPDTLAIEVTEREAAAAVIQDGSAWLINSEGKIVEQRAASAAGDLAVIDGCELLSPAVAAPIALAADQGIQLESLLALMKALDQLGLTAQVQAIHMSDPAAITLDYQERFQVELPYGADYDYKLRTLEMILNSGRIESNETGTIRMTGNAGQNVFIKG
jgi:cell division protein FtsQ